MVTDSIADLLTRIRNAQMAKHPACFVPASKKKERVLEALVAEGYVERFERVEDKDNKPALKVYLRYESTGVPIVREVNRISKPGRRVYVGSEKIPYCKGGLGTILVSTSQGVLTDQEARKRGLGGELICSVF